MEAAAELDSYVDKEKIKEKRDKERQKERARVEKDKENDDNRHPLFVNWREMLSAQISLIPNELGLYIFQAFYWQLITMSK